MFCIVTRSVAHADPTLLPNDYGNASVYMDAQMAISVIGAWRIALDRLLFKGCKRMSIPNIALTCCASLSAT